MSDSCAVDPRPTVREREDRVSASADEGDSPAAADAKPETDAWTAPPNGRGGQPVGQKGERQ